MSKKYYFLFLFSIVCFFYKAQDSTGFNNYKNNVVLYADLGFNNAPFSIKYNFPKGIDKIKYRNNYKAVLGFGIAYKWFAFRIGFDLPGSLRPVSKYGNTSYLDIGTDFTIKRTLIDIDFHNYNGYAIKNAYRWNDSLDSQHPNDVQPTIQAASFSINVWWFKNKEFKMQGLRLKTGSFNKKVTSFYLRSTMNIHGAGNQGKSLIPIDLQDTSDTKTALLGVSAFDFGVIPGYVYHNNHNNWIYAFMVGFAPVIQVKLFELPGVTRTFTGLAPRYDIRLYGGYSVDRYFVILSAEFDNKSIRYDNLKFHQTYYFLKIAAGIRLQKKEKK